MFNKINRLIQKRFFPVSLLLICIATTPVLAQDTNSAHQSSKEVQELVQYNALKNQNNTSQECLRKDDLNKDFLEHIISTGYSVQSDTGYILQASTEENPIREYTILDDSTGIRARRWNESSHQWDCCPKTKANFPIIGGLFREYISCDPPLQN
ncbi:MAG: hypothetical protein AAGD25_01195 [Cyanobacteria bacterium P01_F01_bin.150]